LERSTASSVGEEAEVADADQAFRQNVKKKSAQELIYRNGHDFVLAAVSIVSPAEGDAIVLEGHEAMVGDSYAMSVAGQIVENVFGAAKGRLGIDHPVLLA
jgi:predicted anti-sigma-YlaC factor YlaD